MKMTMSRCVNGKIASSAPIIACKFTISYELSSSDYLSTEDGLLRLSLSISMI